MQSKNYSNIADTIKGEINRICVTDDINELNNMLNYAVNNIYKLFSIRYDDLKNRQDEKSKKKMLFSDRQEIVKEYKKWCLVNNVDGCEASFLAYLCIKGYIDG